jgi:hypothetical protein
MTKNSSVFYWSKVFCLKGILLSWSLQTCFRLDFLEFDILFTILKIVKWNNYKFYYKDNFFGYFQRIHSLLYPSIQLQKVNLRKIIWWRQSWPPSPLTTLCTPNHNITFYTAWNPLPNIFYSLISHFIGR